MCIFVLVKFCFYAVAFLGEALCHVYLERCNTNLILLIKKVKALLLVTNH